MTDTRTRRGPARYDTDRAAEFPTTRYAGRECGYMYTLSEKDYGLAALNLAQGELDNARACGHLACCIHAGTEHHVYVSEADQYREQTNWV